MNKILLLIGVLFLSSFVASAQSNPCYDLVEYCGGNQQCVSDFMPYLYVTCSGDASSMPSWQERYEIASGGMLPPPGGGNPNPNHQYVPCPGPPSLPSAYMVYVNAYDFYIMYPFLLAHSYPGEYCTSWSIEWSVQPH